MMYSKRLVDQLARCLVEYIEMQENEINSLTQRVASLETKTRALELTAKHERLMQGYKAVPELEWDFSPFDTAASKK